MQTENKKQKKALNLSVKTLETRIAPGGCQQEHNYWMEQGGTGEGSFANEDLGVSPGKGAGVPVIGIN